MRVISETKPDLKRKPIQALKIEEALLMANKLTCPKCGGNDLEVWSKKQNFWLAVLVGLIIWPFLLVAPFIPFLPTMYKCKPCKKTFKLKDMLQHGTK